MPNQTNQVPKKDDKKGSTPAPRAKEQEPSAGDRAKEDKLMKEIISTSDSIDKEAIDKLRAEAPEIKSSQPAPELKPDVEDAGVKIPEEEADKVIKNGTTLSLPVSEKAYQQGLTTKVSGKIVGTAYDKVVVGVSGISALALWVGRLLKMAHKHAMKVVFRKGAK